MPSALSTSEPAGPQSTETTPPAPVPDMAAEAAIVLAAVARMQSAAHSDRVKLEQIRQSLVEMADTIAAAKAALYVTSPHESGPDIPALLDRLEQQIDVLLEMPARDASTRELFVEPAPEAVADRVDAVVPTNEADQVPTVSAVVSELGGATEGPTVAPPPDDVAAPDEVPSVATLKALIEAMNASVPPTAEEVIASESSEAAPEPPEQEPAPASASSIAMDELLASYQEMEARLFSPPDGGAAVIFANASEPPALTPPDIVETTDAPVSDPSPEQAFTDHTQPAERIEACSPTDIPPAENTATEHLTPASAPPPADTPSTLVAESNFDPTDFLFGPEPEPDPAAFLLDPQISPAPKVSAVRIVMEPHASFSELTVESTQDAEQAVEPAAEIPATRPARPARPLTPDPLAPIKALSEAERIALFS